MAQLKKSEIAPADELATMKARQQRFVLWMLVSRGKKKYSAGMAGFSGDLAKRSRSLMALLSVTNFLSKYPPPPEENNSQRQIINTRTCAVNRLESELLTRGWHLLSRSHSNLYDRLPIAELR
jgi:hypothetical protein